MYIYFVNGPNKIRKLGKKDIFSIFLLCMILLFCYMNMLHLCYFLAFQQIAYK